MTKRYIYNVVTSQEGLPGLEKEVSKRLNDGWKPIGGISFNQGFPYQAMAKLEETRTEKKEKRLTANEGMKRAEELF